MTVRSEVWRLYERFVDLYDRHRERSLFEAPYLEALTQGLGDGARLLDLGCGTGEPIAAYFLARGTDVTGVDGAPAMIARCRDRFPDGQWLVADMRDLEGLDLTKGGRDPFDAVIAWDSFFHLEADDQRATLPQMISQCADNGRILFTSGPVAGEVYGTLNGEPLYHASLGAEEYRAILADSGFEVLRHAVNDPDCGNHTIWLAGRRDSK